MNTIQTTDIIPIDLNVLLYFSRGQNCSSLQLE